MPLGQTAMTLLLEGKAAALVFQMRQQKAVRQAQGGAGAQRRKNFLVLGCLGGVSNEQEHHVRLANDVIHFSQGAVRLGETGLLSLPGRPAIGPQAHLHSNARALQRFAQVLCLGGPLRTPADDPNLFDALESCRQ